MNIDELREAWDEELHAHLALLSAHAETRWERLHFFLFRRQTAAVVRRRLETSRLKRQEAEKAVREMRERYGRDVRDTELGLLRLLADEMRWVVRLEQRGFLVMERELRNATHLLSLLDEFSGKVSC